MAHKVFAAGIVGVDMGGLEGEIALAQTLDLHAQIAQQVNKVEYIENLRHIADAHFIAGEQGGTYYL